MHVRMKQKIGGFRNGEEWPDKGDTLEVPDHEGADLILAGYAEETRAPDAAPAQREPKKNRGAAARDDSAPAAPDDGQAPLAEPDGAATPDEAGAPPAPEVKDLLEPGQPADPAAPVTEPAKKAPAKKAPAKRTAKAAAKRARKSTS